MHNEIYVWAIYGDMGGSIDCLKFITDYKVTKDNLPNLSEAEQTLRDECTQSWASISINNEDAWGEELYTLEEFKDQGYDLDKCLVVSFTSDGGGTTYKVLYFDKLKEELLRVVKLNQYMKRTYHDGDSSWSDYAYILDKNIFEDDE